MITVPTVLILGAGASMPYGLPSGPQLKRQILQRIRQKVPAPFYDELKQRYGPSQLELFCEALERSGTVSVDAFLEHRSDFIDVGKACIASVLLPAENQSGLFGLNQAEKHWYEHLLQRLNGPFEQFGQNRISIVTFNYDRSLEHFLFTALRNRHNKSREACAEQLRLIQIVHVYGQLGDYLGEPSGNAVPYGAPPVETNLERATAAIRVIHERHQAAPELDRAVQCIQECKRLCLLGFGYDETNVRRLRLLEYAPQRLVHGSTYGMRPGERERAFRLLGTRFHHCEEDLDCLDFLREFCPLDEG